MSPRFFCDLGNYVDNDKIDWKGVQQENSFFFPFCLLLIQVWTKRVVENQIIIIFVLILVVFNRMPLHG